MRITTNLTLSINPIEKALSIGNVFDNKRIKVETMIFEIGNSEAKDFYLCSVSDKLGNSDIILVDNLVFNLAKYKDEYKNSTIRLKYNPKGFYTLTNKQVLLLNKLVENEKGYQLKKVQLENKQDELLCAYSSNSIDPYDYNKEISCNFDEQLKNFHDYMNAKHEILLYHFE